MKKLVGFIGFCIFPLLIAGCALPLGENYTIPRNDSVYITDYKLDAYVPIPYIGEAPVVQVNSRGDLEVKVLWKDVRGKALPSLAVFAPDTIYQAEIQITPKNGCDFSSTQLFAYNEEAVIKQQDDGETPVRTIRVIYKKPLDPNGLDPNVLDPAGDNDRDGFSNGYELDAGTDPKNPASHPGNIISEENLLTVLGVPTVADAIEVLHQLLNNEGSGGPYFDGLKLGMYLDLPSLDYNYATITDDGFENLRIVIASFNQYKNGTNPKDHIKFVFKNILTQAQMRALYDSKGGNYGGYPYTRPGYTPPEHGISIVRESLEYSSGLGGINYLYSITRRMTGGSLGAWNTVAFSAEIFVDTEKEVFGDNDYGYSIGEMDLVQTALYAQGGTAWRIKKYNGAAADWWLASPDSASGINFCDVSAAGTSASSDAAANLGVVPVFCIY
jgi:hypothetical protein